MHLINSALLVLGSALLSSACEMDCRNGINKAFADNYSPIIANHMAVLAEDIKSSFAAEVENTPELGKEIESSISALQTTILSRLPKAVDRQVFTKYRGPCPQDIEGCPNYNCSSLCGSPGSVIYFIDDALQLANAGVVGQVQKDTEPGRIFHKSIRSAITARVGNSQVDVESKLKPILRDLHDRATTMCDESCYNKWTSQIIELLKTFD
ncbi:hypothetical protein K493DRAFT_339372 [Basidiobolus meristosporus CBS 931.73]|uniref:Uncharacterized protein n=1 Tax=Basidiobolus meristosporus CBS 931.73 TaxID=1314790 RepID=A0A1Y1Y074_9FUNG|nr:hypothetical protein K493DRAFT_339372 [Basidiobolus meristosporus CBS 931.73]|eukprot:ORX91413.1 hypothetical protein K493DRAFT_339372 [Basidiobolus meristosporus CBS 931.73]